MPTALTTLPYLPRIAHQSQGLCGSEPRMGLSYDPTSQVTQILHQLTATNTPINQAAYAYNPVGNRTSLSRPPVR